MKKQNLVNIEKDVLKRYEKKDKRKQKKMKVDGASVKNLYKIIKEKL